MTKKTSLQSEPVVEKAPPKIHFTEAEVKTVADFVNLVYLKAKWNHSSEEAVKLTKALNAMHAHVKKLDGYVLEIKEVWQAK